MSRKTNHLALLMRERIREIAYKEEVSQAEIKRQLDIPLTQGQPLCGKNVDAVFNILASVGIALIDKRDAEKINDRVYTMAEYGSVSEILRYACRRYAENNLLTPKEVAEHLGMGQLVYTLKRPLCGKNVDKALIRLERLNLTLIDAHVQWKDKLIYLNPAYPPLLAED